MTDLFHFLGSLGDSDSKESACNARDPGSIPGSGRSPGRGNGYPLQYSYLENPMDRGAWHATVHGVTKSWTWLSMHARLLRLAWCPQGSFMLSPVSEFPDFLRLNHIPLYGWTTFCLSSHPLMDSWVASTSFVHCGWHCCEHSYTNTCSSPCFSSFGYILRNGIAGSDIQFSSVP